MWKEKALKAELFEKCSYDIENIRNIAQYDFEISEKVLAILLEWACYSQNYDSIELGRRKIAEIPHSWLHSNLLDIVKHNFDYSDDWNYRRLLELVVTLLPEKVMDFIALNDGTTNPDLAEVIDDFNLSFD